MSKQVWFDLEAKENLLLGIDTLTKAVKVTMGPKGQNVVLNGTNRRPDFSKDGFLVSQNLDLEMPIEEVGVQLFKQIASKTAKDVGDGTSTCIVLAHALFSQSLKYITAGADPSQVKKGMEKGLLKVKEFLKYISEDISTPEQIKQVATLASNNDTDIGEVLTSALMEVGKDGLVTFEEAEGLKSYVSIIEGARIDKGYFSHHFVTDKEKMAVEFDSPLIMISDHKIETMAEVLPLLEKSVDIRKPLLIIAEDIDASVLSTLILNHTQGAIQVTVIKAPGFGEDRKNLLKDIAIMTGGIFLSKEEGLNTGNVKGEYLGSATKVLINSEHTIILEGHSDQDRLKEHLAILRKQKEHLQSGNEKENLHKRISFLTGSLAKILLSANSEFEFHEKRSRAEIALNAARAAMDEGVVPGGGVAFLRASQIIDEKEAESQDEMYGMRILKKALETPLRVISENVGEEPSVAINRVLEAKNDFGYNAEKGVYEPLINAGIIDPSKVCRIALENAVSLAGLLLKTNCAIINVSDEI